MVFVCLLRLCFVLIYCVMPSGVCFRDCARAWFHVVECFVCGLLCVVVRIACVVCVLCPCLCVLCVFVLCLSMFVRFV